MSCKPRRQHGVALITVVFLIVVVGALAISVGLISGQQQLGSAQALDQTRAYYAARARLDNLIETVLDTGCPTSIPDPQNFEGFTTVIETCVPPPSDSPNVDEGGASYTVFKLEVRAFRGSAVSGTLVQRSIGVQVTDAQ